jgi:exodeoxyribonuclease VII large subunit
VILSVRVQGGEAPAELIGAVRYANRWQVADLIIIGRGGGSMEDLWAFNDEGLARAIYASEIPVISAVGHEPDVTISDYVADLRAATPSNAAELAVPEQEDVAEGLENLTQRMTAALERQLTQNRNRLERCRRSPMLTRPDGYLQERQLRLDSLQRQLIQCFSARVAKDRARFSRDAAALDAMSPMKVLGRGYAMTTRPNGTVVTGASQVEPGERITVGFSDGELDCAVLDRRMHHGESENL